MNESIPAPADYEAESDATVASDSPPVRNRSGALPYGYVGAEVDRITAEICEAHRHYKKLAIQSAEYAIEQGRRLLALQQLVPRTAWEHYVGQFLPFSLRTAQYYMRVATSGLGAAEVAKIGIRAAAEGIEKQIIENDLGIKQQKRRRRWGKGGHYRRSRSKAASMQRDSKKDREKWRDIQQNKWRVHRHHLRRPSDDEVLYAEWEDQQTGRVKVAYAWREEPTYFWWRTGPYGAEEQRAFALVLLEYLDKRRDLDGTQSTNDCSLYTWDGTDRTLNEFFGDKKPTSVVIKDKLVVRTMQHLRIAVRMGTDPAFLAKREQASRDRQEQLRVSLKASMEKRQNRNPEQTATDAQVNT